MTALSDARFQSRESLKDIDFTLASGQKAYQGAQLFQNPANGKVYIGGVATGYKFVGTAMRTVDATSADKTVPVSMPREIWIEWFANGSSSDAVASTDLGKDVYSLDDHTVTIQGLGNSFLGRVWAVSSTQGVAVELGVQPALGSQPDVASYTSNDWAPTAAQLENGAVYDVPTTGAASTITLPAAAQDGTRVRFCADGTKNGHTVTYRDATGPTALTTALTASKRHLVEAQKLGGKWFANAYVSP